MFPPPGKYSTGISSTAIHQGTDCANRKGNLFKEMSVLLTGSPHPVVVDGCAVRQWWRRRRASPPNVERLAQRR